MHLRLARRHTLLVVALSVIALAWIGLAATGDAPGQPSTKNGDWPYYTADLKGTKYSPLDQINASNFNKLEVAWRFKTDNLGTRPEFKLEGTPVAVKGVLYTTAGTRRSVVALDGTTGELIWAHSIREGKRAAIAPRQLSGRGVSFWTDGKGDDRVVYVTTGYRLVELNAHDGSIIKSFGKDGMVDLKEGMVTGTGKQIDLEEGEAGLHSTPLIVKDVVIVGSSFKEGMTVVTHNNTKGLVRAYDVHTGKRLWTFNTIPRPGEFGNDTWENGSWATNGNTGVWTQMTVDEELGLVYLPVESPTSDYYGGERPGNNSIRREPGLRRPEDRRAEVAFPDRASSHLGLRSFFRAHFGRHCGRRQAHQSRRCAEQRIVPICVRPRDRQAGVADRRKAGAAVRRPRREDLAHAALPDQAAGLWPESVHRARRSGRFHSRDQGAGQGCGGAIQDGTDVPPADRRRSQDFPRSDQPRQRQRWNQLARRRVRSRDAYCLRPSQ